MESAPCFYVIGSLCQGCTANAALPAASRLHHAATPCAYVTWLYDTVINTLHGYRTVTQCFLFCVRPPSSIQSPLMFSAPRSRSPSVPSTPELSEDVCSDTCDTDYSVQPGARSCTSGLASLLALGPFPHSSTVFGDWLDTTVVDSAFATSRVRTSHMCSSPMLMISLPLRVFTYRARIGTRSWTISRSILRYSVSSGMSLLNASGRHLTCGLDV